MTQLDEILQTLQINPNPPMAIPDSKATQGNAKDTLQELNPKILPQRE